MKQLFALVILTSASLLLSGCDDKVGPVPGQIQTSLVQLGNMPFVLEIADSYASRERGLMFRKSMPADHGMLFVFDHPEVLGFWMKNTHIALDIIYLDADGRVLTIKQMKPLDEKSVSSERPAKYAIEINAGMAQTAGVRQGDVIHLPGK